MRRSAASLVVFALAVFALAAPARADAIDGDWCHPNGKRFTIEGPLIVTPAGGRTQGDYRRHSFRYVVPAGEPGEGTTIQMVLLDEDTVQLTYGPGGVAQTWHRCGPPVSWLGLIGKIPLVFLLRPSHLWQVDGLHTT